MSTVDWSVSDFQDDAEESPGFMLWKVSTSWRRRIESALAPLGLTHPQFVVLVSIAWLSRSEPATQTAIGAHMNGDPNTVSQILKALESRGLLTRKALDGRTKGVELTESGTALFHQALPTVESADREFFRPLGADTKALATLLGKIG